MMTIKDRKAAWINALHRKLEMRTQEEWDFETMSQTINKDEIMEFYREHQENYVLVNSMDEEAGVEAWHLVYPEHSNDMTEEINPTFQKAKKNRQLTHLREIRHFYHAFF
jgi:hypothetical protein